MNLHAAIVKSLDNEDMAASAIIGEAGAAAALNEHESWKCSVRRAMTRTRNLSMLLLLQQIFHQFIKLSPEPLQWALGMWVLMMDIRLLHRALRRRMK
jgi:hypothetical protein